MLTRGEAATKESASLRFARARARVYLGVDGGHVGGVLLGNLGHDGLAVRHDEVLNLGEASLRSLAGTRKKEQVAGGVVAV